jgi:diguanylate cyclase (GGDEF)-like protein
MKRAVDRDDAGSPDSDVIRQLLAFVEKTSDLVGVVDEQSRVLYLNEAARKRLGVGDSTDLTTVDMFPPQAFARYYEEIRPTVLRRGTWHGELPVITGSGDVVPMAMTVVASVGPGGEVIGLVTYGREAGMPATAGGTLAYDELTGLPGRMILDDRIRVALDNAARDGRGVAVILADVDAMKDINDSFGHAVGDDVLRGLARVLSRCVGTDDTVARFGNDEFVVLVDGLEEADTAWLFAERLRDSVCRIPIETGTGALAVEASFGLATGAPGDEPAELVRRADAAMYRAKAMGGAQVAVFDDAAELSITTLADELAVAVSQGLIRPHVQPIVDLHRGVLVGHQGIARWEHPRRGLLDADQFVYAVANTPILSVVDLAVLRRTVAAATRTARGGLQVRAYGHLSRRLLGDVDLTRYLTEIIDDLGIAASDLCVEIAHDLVARPSRAVDSALRDLREAGVRTVLSAVDGECEVNQIVEYGFDELRLARRLVRDAGRDPARRRVAHGTVALARALGLSVTAVGIESDAERVDMREAGCDYGQGNLFGSAQPAGSID